MKMASDNMDKLLEQIDEIPTQELEQTTPDNKIKERLIQVVAGGKSKQFLGKLYSTDEIEKLDDKELKKLYARYEAVLGGEITQTLKQHIICAYARGVQALCPTVSQGRFVVNNVDQMFQALNNGPFIDLALTSLTCQLYHEYGHFLAPIEAAILTSTYVVEQLDAQQNSASYQQTMQQNSASYQQTMQQNSASYTTS